MVIGLLEKGERRGESEGEYVRSWQSAHDQRERRQSHTRAFL